MDISYSEKAKTGGEYTLLEKATKRLEEAVGRSASLISGQWDRTEDDNGRTLYTLRLKDFTGEVMGRFALDELRSPEKTAFRVYRLWGDLLQVGTQKRLEELTALEGGR
jgi:hypothetical protein